MKQQPYLLRLLVLLLWTLVPLAAAKYTGVSTISRGPKAEDNKTIRVPLTPEEEAYLRRHPVLKVQNESNWPPFNFEENGVARGFSVDYIKLLARKLGVELDFVDGYSWEEFMQMLPTDKLDLIINIAPTEERKEHLVFTRPYIQVRNAIYTNINNQVYYSLSDLRGKKVALPKDFFIQRYLSKHYPEIRQVLVADQLEALQLLSFGKVDAVIGKQVVVDYLLRDHLISNIIATSFINDPGTVSYIALGAARKDAMLIRILDKAQSVVSDEEMERLKHKWFGINALLNTTELLNTEERQALDKKKRLQVCLRPDFAPIEFRQKEKPQGIAVDTITILARRLGMKIDFVKSHSWGQTEELLRNHRCDVLPAALQTRRNIDLLLFTRPYLSYETVLVGRDGDDEVNNLEQIHGLVMAARWDDPVIERLKRSHPRIRVLEFGSYREVFEALHNGKARYAMAARPVWDYYRAHLDLEGLELVGTVPIKSDISIAVRKDELVLFDVFNKLLEAMPRETFRAINDKWTQQTVIRHLDYGLLARYLAGAALLILFVLAAYIRQRRLSRRIEELNSSLEKRITQALEENKQQQALMLHRNRLANMGEMVAMIAHQWRQPLNNLSLLNQLLIAKYRKGQLDDEMIDYFDGNSRKQIEQMSRTIDDFRNFYKPDKEKRKFCIEDEVGQLIDLVKLSFASENIEIVYDAPGCNHFLGYPNELAHAILNIMNNARDAFLDQDSDPKKIRITVRREDTEIVIEICDTAGGIPEKILPRIFDPYFSTKSEKNGTGLGLYMTNMIITEHLDSRILVENREEGACFILRLRKGDDNAAG